MQSRGAGGEYEFFPVTGGMERLDPSPPPHLRSEAGRVHDRPCFLGSPLCQWGGKHIVTLIKLFNFFLLFFTELIK